MNREAIRAELIQMELFADATQDELNDLMANMQVVTLLLGKRLFDEGSQSNRFFVLVRGTVGVFFSSQDGTEVLVKVFGAPACFGEMELFFDLPRQEYVESLEDSVIACFATDAVMHLLRSNNDFCFSLLKDVSARLCIAAYHQRALAFQETPTRLAGFFLSLLEPHGVAAGVSVRLRIRLTYTMLARCLGVTERSIERTLGSWLKQGWITRDRGFYTVLNVERLLSLADPDRLTLYTKLGLMPHQWSKPGP